MPTTRTPVIGRLHVIYQSIGQIISFQMMPPLRSFDDLDGKERGQKKTDDLRAMTTLGPRTLVGHYSVRRHDLDGIKRILVECLLISSLLGKALRTLVDIAMLSERFNTRSQSRAW